MFPTRCVALWCKSGALFQITHHYIQATAVADVVGLCDILLENDPWRASQSNLVSSLKTESSMLVLCLIPFTSMALDSFHSALMCFVSFDLYSHSGKPAGQVIFITFLFMHEKVKAWRGYNLPKVTMLVNSRPST